MGRGDDGDEAAGRIPWIVILVEVFGFGSEPPTTPPLVSFASVLLWELVGGEAETFETTDETTERSTAKISNSRTKP